VVDYLKEHLLNVKVRGKAGREETPKGKFFIALACLVPEVCKVVCAH
jgi:hypothetical protein